MDKKSGGGPSEALKAVARKIAQKYGVRTFGPGEQRPEGYFTPNHYTGKLKSPIDKIKNI